MTIEDVEISRSRAPTSTESHNAADLIAKADRARDARDWKEARTHYEHALQMDPTMAPIWVQLGHAAKESGDMAAAEAAYRKSLELNPEDADGHLQLGHLMKISGRSSAAIAFYSQALGLDPALNDARREILALREQAGSASPMGRDTSLYTRPPKSRTLAPGTLSVIFEVSDLMAYFRDSRLPTGIQRVQMEVIKAVSEAEAIDLNYAIVCFVQERGYWVEVPLNLFQRFCQASLAGGDPRAADWRALISALDAALSAGPLFRFPERGILLDLGTSWWQRNYFLHLRVAKAMHGLRYVPFIHDLIPVMTPEYCAADLRRDFLAWIVSVYHHADFFFANSQATRKDLETVAGKLGHRIQDAAVVTLNADFRRSLDSSEDEEFDTDAYLEAHDLQKEKYVLCVATIEARKNHVAAFSVWLRLIKKHGVRNVPKLVCVGKDGWLNDSVYHVLRASEILSHHVVILQNVPDPALAALYKNSLCTLYPSFYEGWGLPVTEALCYGKIPVVARVSSLPEAGGEFAEYFDIGSENELLAKLERLIFDAKYRTEREEKIAGAFRPRTWRDISNQIVEQLRQWGAQDRRAGKTAEENSPIAELAQLHSLGRGTDVILWGGIENGEVYRHGPAWWPVEDWGCWTKPKPAASLNLRVHDVAGAELLLYLGVRGIPGNDTRCTVRSDGVQFVQELRPEQDCVMVLDIESEASAERSITISINSSAGVDLEVLTGGADKRVIGTGVRWFYICKKSDVLARVAMAEAIAMGDFRRLTRRPPTQPDFFAHT
ncbi:MAG: glycosyltransferase [Alphaproteobacteria bacterium]|nr:glycosyltransferase [Alphaproteobacteria bacterium]